MATMTERVILWDCNDDAEVLHHPTKNEAIEAYLDDQVDVRDGTIQVYGSARMIAPAPGMDDAVDLVQQFFDMNWEELQGEDGWEAPNSTVEAALEFLTVLHRDFVPWACEIVTTDQIGVYAWIAEHRPDWLEAPKP